jgi:hypothetical protein
MKRNIKKNRSYSYMILMNVNNFMCNFNFSDKGIGSLKI